jgi:hypothetical protein
LSRRPAAACDHEPQSRHASPKTDCPQKGLTAWTVLGKGKAYNTGM